MKETAPEIKEQRENTGEGMNRLFDYQRKELERQDIVLAQPVFWERGTGK